VPVNVDNKKFCHHSGLFEPISELQPDEGFGLRPSITIRLIRWIHWAASRGVMVGLN